MRSRTKVLIFLLSTLTFLTFQHYRILYLKPSITAIHAHGEPVAIKTHVPKDKKSEVQIDGKSVPVPDIKDEEQVNPQKQTKNFSKSTPQYEMKTPPSIILPVLIFGCSRVTISRAIESAIKHRPLNHQNPIIVSLDCNHQETKDVVKRYEKDIIIWELDTGIYKGRNEGYYKVSFHYKWALTRVFNIMRYDHVILLEDDMELSPDFFDYFNSMLPLIYNDPTIFCISSWNDQGKRNYASNPGVFLRTDFFPGLGWLLPRHIWEEIHIEWPEAFWDDWLREEKRRKGRSCIIPELTRTKNFGRYGISNGQYFDEHIASMAFQEQKEDFSSFDWRLLIKDVYDKQFNKKVEEAIPLRGINDITAISADSAEKGYVLRYKNDNEFQQMGKTLGLMTDIRANVYRSSYRGVITLRINGNVVHIAPA